MGSASTPSPLVVNISPFINDSATYEEKKASAKDLLAKARTDGFFGVTGHGIPSDLIAQAFALSGKLFDLPLEEKMKAPHPDDNVPHRGYLGIGKENAAKKTATETDNNDEKPELASMGDYKESYEIGSEDNKAQGNIWLPEEVLPGFRQFNTAFYWRLSAVASAMFEAFMLSLELDDQEKQDVRALHTGQDDHLRLLHYPPVTQELLRQSNLTRMAPHRDWSLFTFLLQDASGGLEYEDRATGRFVHAIPRDGVIYVNIGDMLMRLSNGVYPSAVHRVNIPGRESGTEYFQTTQRRYSIPFFIIPKADGLIVPPKSLVKAHGKQVYKPVTFSTYSLKMHNLTLG